MDFFNNSNGKTVIRFEIKIRAHSIENDFKEIL